MLRSYEQTYNAAGALAGTNYRLQHPRFRRNTQLRLNPYPIRSTHRSSSSSSSRINQYKATIFLLLAMSAKRPPPYPGTGDMQQHFYAKVQLQQQSYTQPIQPMIDVNPAKGVKYYYELQCKAGCGICNIGHGILEIIARTGVTVRCTCQCVHAQITRKHTHKP